MGAGASDRMKLRPIERRQESRATLGACPRCETIADVKVATRTDYVIYARCAACGSTWSVPKPSIAPFES